jgi:hypothetical protein
MIVSSANIRYAIRIGIAREEWRVVIHIPDKRLPAERAVFGTWEDAKTEARSMINAWMKKRDKARGSPTNVAKLPDLLGRK